MLGKLLKYDFKALNRFLILIHAMLLAAAVLGRIVFVGRLAKEGSLSDLESIILVSGIFLFVLLFMAAVFGTEVFVGVYFYKNLFSDEGYLTHTLPVSRGQLLASKTIAGSLWILIDQILLILSVVILVMTGAVAESINSHKDELWSALGLQDGGDRMKLLLVFILMLVVSAVANVALLFVSVAVGQLFSSHRVLGAVVVYFCMSTVIGIFSGVAGLLVEATPEIVGNSLILYPFLMKMFGFAIWISLIPAIIFYIVTYLLMKKRLNLN